MAKITFTKLGLKVNKDINTLTFNNNEIEVKQYLPQTEKAELISYILENSIDNITNTFSPVRLEVFFALGLVKWYTNITFTDKQFIEGAVKTYDQLQSSGLLDAIINDGFEINEYRYIERLVNETVKDYEDYANSFAGVMSAMNSDAFNMNKEIDEIMTKIRNKEGLEELAVIRDIVG